VRLAGVVLNRVASERHERVLRDALAATGIPVLGALSREATLHTPSRHLGLVPASERPGSVAGWLPALGQLVAHSVDLDGLMAVARDAPGLAAGRAFTFGYAEHDELLAAAGTEVVPFDPLTAERLPDGTDALVVGGGFPQVYIDQLASNTTLRQQVRERAGAGMPVVAECAGLLWLGATLDGRDQCGVLPTRARMSPTLHLGYREATALHDTPLAAAGTGVRAHEFHRTVCDPRCGDRPAWELADGTRQGWAGPNLLASYLHLHWAGIPGAANRLVRTALTARTAKV
jgi:cobyrinic acid a,c-diamide synthase